LSDFGAVLRAFLLFLPPAAPKSMAMVLYYVSVAVTQSIAAPVDASVYLALPPSRLPTFGCWAAAAENQGEFGPTRDFYSSGSRFPVHPISDLYTPKPFAPKI